MDHVTSQVNLKVAYRQDNGEVTAYAIELQEALSGVVMFCSLSMGDCSREGQA